MMAWAHPASSSLSGLLPCKQLLSPSASPSNTVSLAAKSDQASMLISPLGVEMFTLLLGQAYPSNTSFRYRAFSPARDGTSGLSPRTIVANQFTKLCVCSRFKNSLFVIKASVIHSYEGASKLRFISAPVIRSPEHAER